jgi:hypothetical protein
VDVEAVEAGRLAGHPGTHEHLVALVQELHAPDLVPGGVPQRGLGPAAVGLHRGGQPADGHGQQRDAHEDHGPAHVTPKHIKPSER